MRCSIGQIKTAAGIEVFVLGILQPALRGRDQAEILIARGRLGLEPLYPHEVVEFGLARARRSRSEPTINIFGPLASFLANEPSCEDLSRHSFAERKAGLILRSRRSSAC